jgi:hypothetical protein
MTAIGCKDEFQKLHVHKSDLVPKDCQEKYECHKKVEEEQQASSAKEKHNVQQ